MIVVGLAGPARSGKSTVAMHLIDTHGFAEYAFAEPIKEGLRVMFDLDDDQLYGERKEVVIPWLGVSPRELAQTLGTEWGRRHVQDDVWLRLAQRWLQRVPRFLTGVVFSDVRFENEAEFVRRNGGVIVHLVREDRPEVREHVSERGVAVSEGDLVIRNEGGIDELHRRVDDMLLSVAAA